MQILTWHDKHGDYQYEADDGGHEAALSILQERLDQGYIFWPEDHEDRAKAILEAKNGVEALQLLEERKEHEYEGISFSYTQ